MLPFLGYSPSGKAEGDLVYVNYGRVEDFDKLKNLSVNVTGKIAIMRYGKIFRGNKVRHTGEICLIRSGRASGSKLV